MLNLRRVAQPLYEPISVDEALMHARIDNDVERGYVSGLIRAAREYVEEVSWRTLMGTEWEYALDAWPGERVLNLPRSPLRSITQVDYVDADGNALVLAAGNYVVDTISEPGRLGLKRDGAWPSVTLQAYAGVRFQYVAGYSDVLTSNSTPEQLAAARAAVPAPFIHAIKLLVGHFYENREEMVSGAIPTRLQFGVDALLSPLRAVMF